MASARPIRLDTIAREAAFKLKRSIEYRTSASILLAECRRRVEEGDPDAHGADWLEYCRVHFPTHSVREIDRLIGAGGRTNDGGATPNPAARTDAFDRAWAAFLALDLAGQRDLLRCGAAYALHPEERPAPAAAEPEAGSRKALDWLA